jgi:hypothetical protein
MTHDYRALKFIARPATPRAAGPAKDTFVSPGRVSKRFPFEIKEEPTIPRSKAVGRARAWL